MGRKIAGVSLKYIHQVTARGNTYFYYRRGGQSIPIREHPASPAFIARYSEIHASFEAMRAAPAAQGTFARLIEEYKSSVYFKKLADKTRREYLRYIRMIEIGIGDMPVASIETPNIYSIRDAMSDTPRKADFLVSVLSAILTFGVKRGYRRDNPARLVDKISSTEGHRPWEDDEVARFRARWPVGTVERMAFELMLNTGQRGGDVIRMTRGDYRGGYIKVTQSKTSEKLEIKASNALLTALTDWLEKHPHLMLLTNSNGEQFKKRNFEAVMRRAYDACGLGRDVTSHGLRYTAATVLHELGVDWEAIAAITGHRTQAMVRKYTRQKRLAARAIAALDKDGK